MCAFDQIKKKAALAAKSLDTEKKEKKSRPSKSLSKYLDSQKAGEPKPSPVIVEEPAPVVVEEPAKERVYCVYYLLVLIFRRGGSRHSLHLTLWSVFIPNSAIFKSINNKLKVFSMQLFLGHDYN